jgi:hypothetical protein
LVLSDPFPLLLSDQSVQFRLSALLHLSFPLLPSVLLSLLALSVQFRPSVLSLPLFP